MEQWCKSREQQSDGEAAAVIMQDTLFDFLGKLNEIRKTEFYQTRLSSLFPPSHLQLEERNVTWIRSSKLNRRKKKTKTTFKSVSHVTRSAPSSLSQQNVKGKWKMEKTTSIWKLLCHVHLVKEGERGRWSRLDGTGKCAPQEGALPSGYFSLSVWKGNTSERSDWATTSTLARAEASKRSVHSKLSNCRGPQDRREARGNGVART